MLLLILYKFIISNKSKAVNNTFAVTAESIDIFAYFLTFLPTLLTRMFFFIMLIIDWMRRWERAKMMTGLSTKIVAWLISQNAIDGSNKDAVDYHRYGVEITLSSILNILLIFIISTIYDSIFSGLTFLAVFIPIRQYFGGYHADSYLKCNLVFCISFLCVLIASQYTQQPLHDQHIQITLIISFVFFTCIGPVPNHNKPLHSRFHYWKCKLISVFLYVACATLSIFCIQNRIECGYIIFYTLHLIVVLGFIGLFKERRQHNEKLD